MASVLGSKGLCSEKKVESEAEAETAMARRGIEEGVAKRGNDYILDFLIISIKNYILALSTECDQ